jgi:hypothetical protein
LEKGKIPVEMLVVDHIEKTPTELELCSLGRPRPSAPKRPEFQKIIDCRSAVGRAARYNARPADGTISNISNRLIDLRLRSCQL